MIIPSVCYILLLPVINIWYFVADSSALYDLATHAENSDVYKQWSKYNMLNISVLYDLGWVILTHPELCNALVITRMHFLNLSRPEKSLPQNGNFYAT